MDDGKLGEFNSVQVSSFLTSYVAVDVEKGHTYRFRYRVANVNGFSPYSEVAYIFPFAVPDAPAEPVFVSATTTSVTLTFSESLNNNGVPIDDYELWIDAGDDTLSEFTKVDSYSGFMTTHTLTSLDDSLGDPGTIYRVKFRAVNEDDNASAFSNELIFALGSLPAQPSTPTKIIEESESDSIMVMWEANSGDFLYVNKYHLYADTGLKDEMTLVYAGSITKFLFDSASTSGIPLSHLLFYRFTVTALNFNGESEPSDIAIL